jgi:hypothetical protein
MYSLCCQLTHIDMLDTKENTKQFISAITYFFLVHLRFSTRIRPLSVFVLSCLSFATTKKIAKLSSVWLSNRILIHTTSVMGLKAPPISSKVEFNKTKQKE